METSRTQSTVVAGAGPFERKHCIELAERYHPGDAKVLEAAAKGSPEEFLRLFITAHGMQPMGTWQTHTYARVPDSLSSRDHFFLVPMPYQPPRGASAALLARPDIRVEDQVIWVDELQTPIRLQSIPHTTPFWYFHYDPNLEHRPYASMTLNLKPACPEKCTLCAGAKTGRVNNGMDGTLGADFILERIFRQHPEAATQLDSVAVVTGCFDSFDSLVAHLRDVRRAVDRRARPSTYRVLEHNVETEAQLDVVVGELGYDVFITLECFDQSLRKLALNGNVGRKGRDSRQFLNMMRTYAAYLEARPQLGRRYVRVTYLTGIDSLETMETVFREMAEINRGMRYAKVVPWLSVFTPYADSMRVIQNRDFSLRFLLDAQELATRYFGKELLEGESGSTADGFARGLF